MAVGKEIVVGLRVKAFFESALEQLVKLRKGITGLDQGARGANGLAFQPLRDGMSAVADQVGRAKAQLLALAGVGVGLEAVRGLAALSDSVSALDARLRVATRGQREFEAAQAQSVALARQYIQPLNETATLFTRLLRSVTPLGGGVREAAVATEALLAALRINGSATAEAQSAILQFSQALGAGALRGEEFNAIAEAAPPLLDALAAGLGKPRDQLKSLAEQGKLTTSAIVAALSRQLPELRRQAGQIPETISGATQQVRDAFARFVGASASGSEGIRTVIAVLKLLADNIEPIVKALLAMAVVIPALRLAAFANGLYAVGAAAAVGATGAAAFGLAVRGVIGALTGGFGLIVLLGSLAAAWLGLDSARKKAEDRTIERVKSERAALAAQIDEFDRKHDNAGRNRTGRENPAAFGYSNQLKARLAKLDAELTVLERKAFEDARRADLTGFGDQNATADMQDPRTIEEFKRKYPTRQSVKDQFAEERANFITAQDRKIAAARAKGDLAAERALQKEKTDLLFEQEKERAEALRRFDKDSQTTRLAQARDLYDKQADLVRDSLEREIKANEDAFNRGVVDAQQYIAERGRLNASLHAEEVAGLEAQLKRLRTVYDRNLKLPTAGLDANQRAERAEAMAEQAEKIARLEADIEKRKRGQVDAERELLLDAGQLADELRRQTKEIDLQLAEAAGRSLTPDQIRQRVTEQFREQMARLRKAGGDEFKVLELIDLEATRQQLLQVEREFNAAFGRMEQREQAIQQDVGAGRLTALEADRKILDLRREEVRVLDEILMRAQALAATPEEKRRIEGYRLRIQAAKDYEDELSRVGRSTALSGLQTLLTDVATGAKSGKAALLDMVGSFARAMLDVLNKQLAKALLDQALEALDGMKGAGGGGVLGAVGSFFAGLFHAGGVVGGGGAMRAAFPGMFAFAPRYHSGGIAGLRANEVPAVLLRGEEVLTADDPRHVRNFGARGGMPAIGALNIAVSTEGTGADPATGRQLARALETAVLEVITREMRPGGILQEAGRR